MKKVKKKMKVTFSRPADLGKALEHAREEQIKVTAVGEEAEVRDGKVHSKTYHYLICMCDAFEYLVMTRHTSSQRIPL